VEIATTDTKQSQNTVEKSLQVNSTQFATIEIEGLEIELRSARLLFWLSITPT
jgi:hypothetical protein